MSYLRTLAQSDQLTSIDFKSSGFEQENLERMPPAKYKPADIVINFGLMYNLENPIAV